MITVKAKDLKNNAFIGGLQKVANFPFKKAQTGMQLAVTLKAVQSTSQSLQDKFTNLVKEYGTIEEDHSYKIHDEKMEEWKKVSKEFEEMEIELPGQKINLSELDGAGLTAVDLMVLEPIVYAIEAVK